MIRMGLSLFAVLLLSSPAARGATVLFADDFEDGVLSDQLIVSNYIYEENGSFAHLSELDVAEKEGELAISGTGNIDIVVVEGHYVGWIGRSVYLPIEQPTEGMISIEADVEFRRAVLAGGGSDSGYSAGLILEAGPADRIIFELGEAINSREKRVGIEFDEADNQRAISELFPHVQGRSYRFRLDFDSGTGLTRGFIDGVKVLENSFNGPAQISRAGVMATVRTRGDVLDARFDNVSIALQKRAPVDGARRTVRFELDGDRAAADVTLEVEVEEQYTLREEFDPGWTVSNRSEGGQADRPGALVWENQTARTLSYRLSRADGYFKSAATIAGWVSVGDLEYSIGGDGEIPGSVTPYVKEVLVTPAFRMGGGLNGCTVRPADVQGPWIGNCLGRDDATIIPAEDLTFRPTFQSQWSQAAGLDAGLSPAARQRFWTDPADPQNSRARLARVEADTWGGYDWQSDRAFGANVNETMCVAYFYVVNPEASPRRVHLGIGSDDSSGIRLNGVPVGTAIGCGGPACYDGKYPLDLRPGKNLIAFYTFEGFGHYNACFRFEDERGAPLPVRTTLDPAGYTVEGALEEDDCNGNCVPDHEDLSRGTSSDREGNGIPDECQPPDCNRNGTADGEDIATGGSRDADGDGTPDECQDAFTIEPMGSFCVAVRLTTTHATRGGEVGLAYDGTKLIPGCPEPGPDFPGTRSDLLCDITPAVSCALPAGMDHGLTIAWIHQGTGQDLPPGSYRLFELCFAPVAGALPAEGPAAICSPIRFTRCLGVGTAPVENVVTTADNRTLLLFSIDGEVCGSEKPFRRGDSNGDGRFDITDAITGLGCLFLGDRCPSCRDAADANDDGRFDISDSIYLLEWRFLGGPAPAEPHLACGRDPTHDPLAGCDSTACP